MGWSWWALGNRPVFFPFCFILLGVVGAPWVDVSPWWAASAAVVLAALGFWWAPRTGSVLVVLGSCLAVGVTAATLGLGADVPDAGPALLEGEVEAVSAHPQGQTLTLAVSRVDGVPARLRASLSTSGVVAAGVGQRVLVPARLRALQPVSNPGEWDRVTAAARRGQAVTGGFEAARLVVLSPRPAWRRWLERRHASLRAQVHRATGDEAAAAFFLTLAAGQRAELGEALEDDFSRSGLAHVLSVSGLHVAVLALAVFRVLRWLLSRRMRRFARVREPRAWAGPLAVPVVWAYVVFTGLQAPAVRSAVMCSLLLVSWWLRRRSDGLNALATAGLVMVVVDPAAPWELSVQLSFLAVFALILLAPLLRRLVPVPPPSPATLSGWRLRLARWGEAGLQTFTASAAVTLATAPLLLRAFQRVSLAGLVSNVVTLPLSGLLTVLAAATSALHLVAEPLATPTLWLGLHLSQLFVWLAQSFARAPGASLQLPAPAAWLAAAFWAGLALIVLARRWGRALGVALAAGAACWCVVAAAPAGDVDVTFLAVGHGDAVVIRAGGAWAVVDGGGVVRGRDTGRRYVLPFLRARGVRRLDLAVLSHAHPDHALGLVSTLAGLPTARLWLPAEVGRGDLVTQLLQAAGDARVESVAAGSPALALGDARIEVLGPPPVRGDFDEENDRSVVLRLTHGEVRFLLTGDVEAAAEAQLDPGPVTVLKAPHHGSDTSSTPDFVARTRPKYVVFCVGRDNRYDFPREDVAERWRDVGARCLRTDLDGAVTFHSDGRDVTVETFAPTPVPRARWRPVRRPGVRAE